MNIVMLVPRRPAGPRAAPGQRRSRSCASTSAASCSSSGRFWQVKGPGLVILIPVVQQMVRVDLRTVVHRRAAAGRDLARQRLGEGQRGGLLPRRRSAEGDHPGRALPRRHQPARADHAALGARQARARRDAGRAREAQPSTSSTILDAQTDAWGIKVAERRDQARRPQRSRWCAPSPARPKPSASGAPR